MSHVLPKKHLKRPLQTDFRAKCSKTELGFVDLLIRPTRFYLQCMLKG